MTEQSTPAITESQPRRRLGGLAEWFTRRRALHEARSFRTRLSQRERHALSMALPAKELADRAYDPIDPLRSGSSLALSVSLYREAAYWALLLHHPELDLRTLQSLFDSVPWELVAFAAGGEEAARQTRRALVERSFVDSAGLPPELLPVDAELAREFVTALLRLKLAPELRINRLLLQRALRCAAFLGLVFAIVLVSWLEVSRWRRGPDLAEGKPWQASSSAGTCHPAEHRCAGAHTDMFFTTSEEVGPWLQIDLGKDVTFNRVEVTNRDDCCPDRATPLIVEVSRDAQHWREVSRRNDTFNVWVAQFAAQNARYVRLRVPRRTILHLVKVAVRHAR